jgi:hypothetical protein
MGLMDKVKEQAAQALNKAQHGVSQGKAKIDEAQAKHQWDGLLRDLGAAVYAEQREGGSSDAVTAALAALDAQAERVRAEGGNGSTDGAGDGGPAEEGGEVATNEESAPIAAGTVPDQPATGEPVTGSTVGDEAPAEG